MLKRDFRGNRIFPKRELTSEEEMYERIRRVYVNSPSERAFDRISFLEIKVGTTIKIFGNYN